MQQTPIMTDQSYRRAAWKEATAATGAMPDSTLLKQLIDTIDLVLDPELSGVQSLALVDFPDHSNVGDSAIYLGEIAWLERNGIVPGYVASLDDFSQSDLRTAVPDGPIIIHGGGNLGDIWPHHQRFRESLLKAFPDRRIVQFPQTIHFDDAGAQARMAEAIAAHGNFLLLVRDRRSLELAKNAFACEVRLCPDMALALGSLARPADASHDLMLLLRTDIERVTSQPYPSSSVDTFVSDWLDEPACRSKRTRWGSAVRAALVAPSSTFNRNGRRERLYRALVQQRVARGLRLLASGRAVITDRLHGHILSLLLGIPHIVLDNRYGKLESFIKTWTAPSCLVERADGLQQALERWDKRR